MDVVTKPRLLDEIRQVLRRHHYGLSENSGAGINCLGAVL